MGSRVIYKRVQHSPRGPVFTVFIYIPESPSGYHTAGTLHSLTHTDKKHPPWAAAVAAAADSTIRCWSTRMKLVLGACGRTRRRKYSAQARLTGRFGRALLASLGGVLYGYNQGVFSSVQVMDSFIRRYPAFVSLLSLCRGTTDRQGEPSTAGTTTKGLVTAILGTCMHRSS